MEAKLTLFLLLLVVSSFAQNNYPIVLLHGFLGWGRDELLGFKYWGGLIDLQNVLRAKGYEVYTASVGPISSCWDRSAELYAQIKGGTVDYGLHHSTVSKHNRTGRTFPGLYPQWGTVDPKTGEIRKVHLLAHSQGSQDVRILSHLLHHGDPEEIALTPPDSISPLFTGNHDWIASVTTLGGPHDGTTLATGINTFLPFIKNFLAGIAALSGIAEDNFIYDFKLDQWGLQRREGEPFQSYVDRVLNSSIFSSDVKDLSNWDLSPDGAATINGYATADPDVYYITIAADSTFNYPFNPIAYPTSEMLLFLWPTATFMGAYTRFKRGQVIIDSSWFHSDGVVNTRSMHGPTLNSTDSIIQGNVDRLKPGVFNDLGTLQLWDHLDLVGLSGKKYVVPLFENLAEMLQGLPIVKPSNTRKIKVED